MSSSTSLPDYCSQLSEFIQFSIEAHSDVSATEELEARFSELATQLFQLQFTHNEIYRAFCEGRGVSPKNIKDWSEIPAVPAAAFKDVDLSCMAPEERTHVFHSSGTTAHRPSRHFHSARSLRVYEASLLPWFRFHLMSGFPEKATILSLTPSPAEAPHSSLVHMFETVRREFGVSDSFFAANVLLDDSWQLNSDFAIAKLERLAQEQRPVLLLGTAFSYVHLLDQLAKSKMRLLLPARSRLLETGGYKGRSRSVPRTELYVLLERHLGIQRSQLVSEYGMSELSSQAYDTVSGLENLGTRGQVFRFPPWARAILISPETGAEVDEGQTGLIRVIDLANAYSVMAIQTEDLGIRREDGFDLLGRTTMVEPRGCSLMPAA